MRSESSAAPARRIPMLDLAAEDREVGGAVRAAIDEVLASRQYILGPHVERFEQAIAAYCGVAHAVGVASGTDALVLSLMALGVGPGAVVVTTPFSFFATASTIVRLGARPLFVDIEPRSMNIDAAAVEAALATTRENVVGLVPVHLFGRLASMDALGALADRRGLWIVEDAAQAIGARDGARAAGTFGRAACFSFYPTKNLGGLGDGGLILTNDAVLADRLRRERHHGQIAAYEHETIGLCSRLDAVQAAALGAKLPFLDGWNARRRAVAGWYDAHFRGAGLAGRPDAPIVLPESAGAAHVYHQYVVRARERDRLATHLRDHGIATQVYYRVPLHRQSALTPFALRVGELPEAERAAASVLALPIHPSLAEADVAAVVETTAAFYRTL